MRVVIKKARTNEFYIGNGCWSCDRDQAKPFNNSVDAMKECAERKLQSEIVLSFRDPRYDLKVPCKK